MPNLEEPLQHICCCCTSTTINFKQPVAINSATPAAAAATATSVLCAPQPKPLIQGFKQTRAWVCLHKARINCAMTLRAHGNMLALLTAASPCDRSNMSDTNI